MNAQGLPSVLRSSAEASVTGGEREGEKEPGGESESLGRGMADGAGLVATVEVWAFTPKKMRSCWKILRRGVTESTYIGNLTKTEFQECHQMMSVVHTTDDRDGSSSIEF